MTSSATLPLGADVCGDTQAARAALANLGVNLASLERVQPGVAGRVACAGTGVNWAFARDGALSAMEGEGLWWANCSLPHRAAQAMLKGLTPQGTTGCFLHPTHAAQIKVALDLIGPQRALVCIVPTLREMAVALHCQDFSDDIRRHRLWFAAGDNWPAELAGIWLQQPGLPTPQQFIRTPLLGEVDGEGMIATAQRVFSAEAQRRSRLVEELRAEGTNGRRDDGTKGGEAGHYSKLHGTPHSPVHPRLCVLAPSHFRLWDDAGAVLAEVMAPANPLRLDPDDPASASSLALAIAGASCRAIMTANAGRLDLSDVLHRDLPLISWITSGRIPPAASAGPHDVLMVAEEGWVSVARARGWGEHRVIHAGWPGAEKGSDTVAETARRVLRTTVSDPFSAPLRKGRASYVALIADTQDITPDRQTFELSSQRLLWERIASELTSNPLALGDDPATYLASAMRELSIGDRGFEHGRFLEHLLIPAYQQGVARLALKSGLPLRIFGHGWPDIPEFAPHAAGPITSRHHLLAAASTAHALLHVCPTPGAHPIDALDRLVIRPDPKAPQRWLSEAHHPPFAARKPPAHRLCVALIATVIAG